MGDIVSASTVYYFVDSNLFLQCRPLEQLDWTPWNAFEEVRLIVSSPVLREIDYRKNKGSDRVGTRARATSAMFREMLQEGHKVVRASSPRVVLSIEPQHTYSRDLEERLNYQARDDQLVGTVHKFSRGHRDRDVRLLTHDTTPLYMAHGLDLAADQISDDWLLPPETTAAEKELASLKTEYARLKKTEPSISIRCMDPSDSEVERYHARELQRRHHRQHLMTLHDRPPSSDRSADSRPPAGGEAAGPRASGWSPAVPAGTAGRGC